MMASSDAMDRAREAKGGGRYHDPFDERVPVDLDAPIELTVHNDSGEVAVRATDRPDVRIRSERSGRSDRGGRLDVNINDNRIDIRAGAGPTFDLGLGDLARDITKGILGRGEPSRRLAEDAGEDDRASGSRSRGGGRFDILVEIPLSAVETVAQLRTASGELSVEGLIGEVSAASASGDVSLRRLRGTVLAQTASGGIDIAEVEGEVRARSASGAVHIGRSDLESCTVQTASGDIQLERTRLVTAGSVKIDTVSGDADLDLGLSPAAGALGAVLESKTVSGDLRVAPPLAKVGKRTWQAGPGNEGCPRIETRSVSGDLTVKLTLDVAESPVPPGPPRRPRPPRDERDSRPERGAFASAIVPPVPAVPPVPPVPPAASTPLAPASNEGVTFSEDAEFAERDAFADREGAEFASRPSPAPPVETAGERERLAILTALEQGEIDIDEAMRRLDPLGGEPSDAATSESPEER